MPVSAPCASSSASARSQWSSSLPFGRPSSSQWNRLAPRARRGDHRTCQIRLWIGLGDLAGCDLVQSFRNLWRQAYAVAKRRTAVASEKLIRDEDRARAPNRVTIGSDGRNPKIAILSAPGVLQVSISA